ncbi:MAG: hypothetical protein PHT99_01195 [Methanoregula sp.]|nr:hypothetical protein [Methanoregula sp.]
MTGKIQQPARGTIVTAGIVIVGVIAAISLAVPLFTAGETYQALPSASATLAPADGQVVLPSPNRPSGRTN